MQDAQGYVAIRLGASQAGSRARELSQNFHQRAELARKPESRARIFVREPSRAKADFLDDPSQAGGKGLAPARAQPHIVLMTEAKSGRLEDRL
jgi:hypothetical protein